MGCKFDKEIIHKYIDNTIDPLELIFLKEHIKVCEECKNELELMSKLEDSLYSYFDEQQFAELPEAFSMTVLDKCTEDSKRTLKQRTLRAVEANKALISNSTRFVNYLPGSKTAGKAAKTVSRGVNKALKGCLSYGVRKLISSTAK